MSRSSGRLRRRSPVSDARMRSPGSFHAPELVHCLEMHSLFFLFVIVSFDPPMDILGLCICLFLK